MRIMRAEENRPIRPNTVRFECHIEYVIPPIFSSPHHLILFRMTKNDVRQYLEKIYKIDVLDVTTIIQQGV